MPVEPERDRSLDILVLDTSPSSQSMLLSLLETSGHRSYAAGGIEEALTAIEEFEFDLLVVNTIEPDRELYNFIKLLRFSQIGEQALPVLLLTALFDETISVACDEAAIDRVLVKPISPGALMQAIILSAAPERRRGNGTGNR